MDISSSTRNNNNIASPTLIKTKEIKEQEPSTPTGTNVDKPMCQKGDDIKNEKITDSIKEKIKPQPDTQSLKTDVESTAIIELDENKNVKKSKKDKKEKKEKKEKKTKKANKKKNTKEKMIAGYTPFVFFEKEKCKSFDFKIMKTSEYMKILSAQWKNMSNEDKEPYVNMAKYFKENEASEVVDKKLAFIGRKRGRKPNGHNKDNGHTNNDEKSPEQVGKKEKKSKSIKKTKESVENGKCVIEINDENVNNKVNQYMFSVVVPFINDSFHFWKENKNKKCE